MSVTRLENRDRTTLLADAALVSDFQNEPKRLGGLVLARQVGQSIMVGDSILIEVIALKSDMVRLRIAAPRSVAIHRREVYDAIRLNQRVVESSRQPETSHSWADPANEETPAGHLILSRRSGETIMIGDSIALDIVEARPGITRIRIIAPRTVAVHRLEIYDAIHSFDQD